MESREIRRQFLEYFRQRGHEVVKSSPLLPHDDPTLLFTNAGMVQFKGVFLGLETRPYSRATSCQKCMRAGGKHSDLENVGHTARHHTFFEMLGNFSFGDYFKRDAIVFAWELLTEWFKLPKEKLWVSVFEEDDEAENLWKELTDVNPSQIVRLGAKDNFWQMGDTGPCGPCSEIIIDQGEEAGCKRPDCNIECDCDRYLELWNLVFMQFNRDEKGNLSPLPKPSIDTGMGLERISAVLQGKQNNFDTDLFSPIISAITSLKGIDYHKDPKTDASIRVIADHIRASVFLLAEGLVPSNEGRGYVLRRIIRRASRHARLLGTDEPFLHSLVDSVVDAMGDVYPEIIDERHRVSKLLKIEEERFIRTVEKGLQLFDDILKEVRQRNLEVIPGDELFRLYDTFGFPLDLARDIANDEGYRIDEEGFRKALENQRQRARASRETEDMRADLVYSEVLEQTGPTHFTGYEELSSEATIMAILKDGKVVDSLSEEEEGEIVLDRTPFYAESGGQVGDRGIIHSDQVHMEVIDTKKPIQGLHVHRVKVLRGEAKRGMVVTASVEAESRRATMRNHTATHLLHRALRMVLGEHVKQSGSLVEPRRLRFDFTHYDSLSPDEIKEIEDIVNEKIMEDLKVTTEVMDIDEAISSGAMALFDEKYGDRVRVVSAGNFSRELCGGTHCSSTGQIGAFKILSEGSVASGIRRIEAITGEAVIDYLRKRDSELNQLKEILKTDSPLNRVEKLMKELKELEREVERLKTSGSSDVIGQALERAIEIDGAKVVAIMREGLNHKELRLLADRIKDRIKSGVIIAGSVKDSEAAMVCMVTKDLTNRFHAGEIIKRIAKLTSGKGGGKDVLAQGGTKDTGRFKELINNIKEVFKEG
ncbi:MAG: alanine--tRNA ligase [Nitrospirae bacterium]|nr:MAG: alanine--tRNA ligase [Nitrospirota bacterium]